ncbi:MAG TPA: efflux RND transporter permease subunit, partial [Kofleriaceae bacterium]
ELCGPEDETRIVVDPARLAASGKTIEDLRAAIASATPASAPSDPHTDPVPAYADLPLIRDTARVETDASFSSCFAMNETGARTLAITVFPQVGADPLEVRLRLEAILPKLAAELQAMRLDVWSRARPLAYEILLDPEMSMQRRVEKLRRALAQLHLSTRALVQLGLPDQDPDLADLRIAPPAAHVPELEASLAAAFARENLTILDRHDHVVGFSGADLVELRKQSAALVAALATAHGLRVVEQLGGEDRPQPVVTLDRDRAAALGVTASEIATTLRVLAPGGMWVSTWFYPRGQQRVMLAVDGAFPDLLDQVRVRSTTGGLVPLSTVATVTETREPDVIFHEGQFPWIGVRVAGPIDALQNVLAKLPTPATIRRDVLEPD